MNKKLMLSTAIALGIGWGTGASAGLSPVIGLDPTGSGSYTTYADLWTHITDTGVDVGALTVGATHSFHTQARVGTMSLAGNPVTPDGLNDAGTGFEITKLFSFQDQLTSITPIPSTPFTLLTFGHIPNTGPNLTIYLDNYSPTDLSQAIPGDTIIPGASGVNCYGAGPTSTGCGNTATGDGDGTKILEARLIANSSSFLATAPGAGTGQFDLLFEITYWNEDYLDLSNLIGNGGTGIGPVFRDRVTGTLAQPTGPGVVLPAKMWDGTLSPGNGSPPGSPQLFKIDASESFFAQAVPEPGSITLLGIGLVGLATLRRRKIAA